MPNPIMSLKFVHDAISAELQDLESRANAATTAENIGALADSLEFFCELMKFHHRGEEQTVFPLLEEKDAGVSASYLDDHVHETKALSTLREAAAAAKGGKDVVLADFQRELSEVAKAGLAHIEKENTEVLPWLAEHFSPAEQGKIVGEVVGAIPKEKMPALVPWIINRLNADAAIRYVQGLRAGMPAPVFTAAQGWIQGGVSEDRWAALLAGIPELA